MNVPRSLPLLSAGPLRAWHVAGLRMRIRTRVGSQPDNATKSSSGVSPNAIAWLLVAAAAVCSILHASAVPRCLSENPSAKGPLVFVYHLNNSFRNDGRGHT